MTWLFPSTTDIVYKTPPKSPMREQVSDDKIGTMSNSISGGKNDQKHLKNAPSGRFSTSHVMSGLTDSNSLNSGPIRRTPSLGHRRPSSLQDPGLSPPCGLLSLPLEKSSALEKSLQLKSNPLC